jgi:transcriptional regulator with XRE-family HTH domain
MRKPKLTQEQAMIIMNSQKSNKALAFEFGVSQQTIIQYRKGRRYAQPVSHLKNPSLLEAEEEVCNQQV